MRTAVRRWAFGVFVSTGSLMGGQSQHLFGADKNKDRPQVTCHCICSNISVTTDNTYHVHLGQTFKKEDILNATVIVNTGKLAYDSTRCGGADHGGTGDPLFCKDWIQLTTTKTGIQIAKSLLGNEADPFVSDPTKVDPGEEFHIAAEDGAGKDAIASGDFDVFIDSAQKVTKTNPRPYTMDWIEVWVYIYDDTAQPDSKRELNCSITGTIGANKGQILSKTHH